MVAPERPQLTTIDVHTSGLAIVAIAKWSNGRVERWAYEPGSESVATADVFDACARGSLTRDEALAINDEIVQFMEGCTDAGFKSQAE